VSGVRPPAVAGTFYPADSDTLRAQVRGLLDEAERRVPASAGWPKAFIAPRAGYVYSGPVAATAYARLAAGRGTVTRVVLLGPAHFVPVRGIAATGFDAWRTPLGDVTIDLGARERAVGLGGAHVDDEAHAPEHSIEVHLPFLQEVLGDFFLAPFAVGQTPPEHVAGLLDELWGGDETVVVVSSDLSHYHDHRTATELDKATAAAIEALDPEAVRLDAACGVFPVRGLLVAAREKGLPLETIDLRTSGDTAGPKDRVVGYGAFITPAQASHALSRG
jgi:AmmeMemoRadiSam system protein B